MDERSLNGYIVLGIYTLFCLLLLVSTPVHAGNAQLLKLMEILRDKGTLSQEEFEMLRGAADADEQQLPRQAMTEIKNQPVAPIIPQLEKADNSVQVSTKGGLKVKSANGDFEFKVGGRIMADAAFYDDDSSDIASGTELRRARLEVSGKIYDDWKYKAAVDFADNEVDGKSFYIAYGGWDAATVKAGFYGMPFGLGAAVSSKYATFMETPTVVNAFEVDDHIGFGLESGGETWSAKVALFGEGAAANDVDDEGWGASARITFAPLLKMSKLLHLGGSIAFQNPDSVAEGTTDLDGNGVIGGNVHTVRFRSRPEAHVNVGRLVDTGSIYNVDRFTSYGLELASVLGPFSVYGEYIATNVARNGGNSDLTFDGYYGAASWFLTGESRPYAADSGEFGRVKPRQNFSLKGGGPGAWEVAARYSVLDLTDGSLGGGREDNITLGLNWYINPQLRMMVNYVMVDVDSATGVDNDPKITQTRLQLDF
jgi:phosphate-selective porin OprO and OprP